VRALFLVPWPSDAASTRLRAEQYFPHLRQQGIEPILRPFISPNLYRVVYRRGRVALKMVHVVLSTLRRVRDVLDADKADVVFVHREAFPFGTTRIERAIAARGTPLVLDFDDAIYLPASSSANRFVRGLKRPEKVGELARLSRAVIVGNRHLQEYALPYNPHTIVMATPVDTAVYRPRAAAPDPNQVVIGWIGSGTTLRYLETLVDPLERLLKKHPNVQVRIIGGRARALERLPRVTSTHWSREGELAALHGLDIGLMPYPDNEWARGKCAFKALLYMSVGVPSVCSRLGMAEEVIDSGENGYLVRTGDEWFEALDQLVSDPALRARVGAAGREVVETRFSLESYAPRFAGILQTVAASRGRPVDAPLLSAFGSPPPGVTQKPVRTP
jgi:glycosyltransferase involved in cell wall biosynthesis